MADSVTNMQVYSRRMGMTYAIHRFSEYRIDIDLEVDSDGFNFVFENPDGAYTGFFNKFDPVNVLINDIPVLYGTIDYTKYVTNDSQSIIQIVGRDIMSPFVDNDAIPITKNNVKPASYIAEKCLEYGITKYTLDQTVPITSKLIIGTGESEISVMDNLIIDDHKRLWTVYDHLYMGEWNTTAEPSYYFTRGVPLSATGIPIKSLELTDDGTDTKSEVRIYGSMDDGNEKVVGISKNDYMVSQGIKKRKTIRSSNNDSSTKYASSALRHIRDGFMSGITLEITIKTSDVTIMPNKTAHVIDSVTKINSIFFIRSVSFSKSLSGGSLTTITMIPGDTTFNVLWNNQADPNKGNITGKSGLSLNDLLTTRK